MLNNVRSIGAASLALNLKKVLGQNNKIIFFSPTSPRKVLRDGAILSKS
jgi:hypothetical protein